MHSHSDTQSPSHRQAGACVTELAGWKQTSLCPEAQLYPTGSWSVSWDTQDEGGWEEGEGGGAARKAQHQLELHAKGSDHSLISLFIVIASWY